MKKTQTVTSISLGMGAIGQQRLARYKKCSAAKGYESLSALIIDLVDKDLGVDLPKPMRRKAKKKN